MGDDTRFIDESQRIRAEGKSDEKILSFLRTQECSKVESMVIFAQAFGLNLGQAKETVHMSQTWADVRERDDRFHDSLEQGLRDLENE